MKRPGVVVYVSCTAMIIGLSVVLTGVFGLWDERPDATRYEVEFGRSGDQCLGDEPGLTIDVKTGAELGCERRSNDGGFSEAEAGEVLALADRLASNGGLSAADQDRIRHLAQTISERHAGDQPSTRGSRTAVIIGAVLFGLGALLGGGWVIIRRRPPSRHGRHSVRRRTT